MAARLESLRAHRGDYDVAGECDEESSEAPSPTPVVLVCRGTLLIAQPLVELPPLTQEQVRCTLEAVRR